MAHELRVEWVDRLFQIRQTHGRASSCSRGEAWKPTIDDHSRQMRRLTKKHFAKKSKAKDKDPEKGWARLGMLAWAWETWHESSRGTGLVSDFRKNMSTPCPRCPVSLAVYSVSVRRGGRVRRTPQSRGGPGGSLVGVWWDSVCGGGGGGGGVVVVSGP
jgi:hypothetical protein